jgi:sortase A
MRRRLALILALCLMAALACPASALEYTFEGTEAGPFAEPTSEETVYVPASTTENRDVSKNAAYIPPAFGSPTSYLQNRSQLLTPDYTPLSAEVPAVGETVLVPTAAVSSNPGSFSYTAYTPLTADLYYNDGSIGTLTIPSIGLTVKAYEGTDNASLALGAGHFSATSVWDGNVGLAAHNRGTTEFFGKLSTLSLGDTITYTTRLGTRSYAVSSVSKISVEEVSVLDSAGENTLTLITCVRNEPQYRWCVKAAEIV